MNIYHVCLGFIGHLDLIELFIQERAPANDVHSQETFKPQHSGSYGLDRPVEMTNTI